MNKQPVIVLVAPGFEEVELVAPVDILRRLGIEVVLAGVSGLTVEGAHGICVRADMLLVDVEPEKYCGVILPGGQAAWTLRDTPAALALVREMHSAEKLVAAICAAPIVLEAAGVLSGRRVTSYPAPGVRDELTSVKCISEEQAVTDGHIITGRGPGAALDFGFALGAYLGCESRIAALKEEMCYPYTAG
ncbi:MAG: DJ-1/PfpI family protein [Akkermansiaceae bacterium]|nr:DJ-1/PfpI family protein [Akkermansiaceae bacterium]